MSDHPDNLAELRDLLRDRIEALAGEILGEHNKALSNRRTLRFGSKGSLAVELTGRKKGAWYSHEAGAGGGPLDLIKHAKGGDVASAITWARNWIGQAEEAPRPPPRRPEPATAADPEREAAIADARRIWAESGPVAGTRAEQYLVAVRKIPAPPNGWPGTVIRWNASESSLVVAATRADGTVQGIQRVELTRDGQNKRDDAGKKIKRSRGPQDGAVVRLPGDPAGPLLVAEGPETGLSVWRATGFETWVALGSMAKAELPTGRRVVICADDDARRATKGKAANAAKVLRAAVAGWRNAGADLVVAYPWEIRRGDKSDFNDAMQAEGVEAVGARIKAALHPTAPAIKRVPVKQARELLAEAVAGFIQRARGWVPTDDHIPALPPPVEMIRVDVGAGKSEAARRGLVRLVAELRAAGDRRNVAILVPTHALGEEQAQRIMALPEAQKAELRVRVWRGRKAADPEALGKTMCRDLEAVELVQSVALDVQSTVCQQKESGEVVAQCPFFAECGYQRQREEEADIWLAAHELLFLEKPRQIGKLAAVVVDEKFTRAGLVLSDQDKAGFPLDLLDAPASVPGDSLGTQRLEFLHRLVLNVLRDHNDGPLLRERVLASGMTADSATEAHKLEWSRKMMPGDLVPGMAPEARKAAVAAAAGNAQVVRLAGFWNALRALLADGGPEESGWLALNRADDGTRLVVTKWRRDVAAGWQVPTLILDAILQPDLVRPFYPQARLVADIAVATPHMRVRQVIDRAYSLAMLHPVTPEAAETHRVQFDKKEAQRRKNNLRDLRVRIDTEARRVRHRGKLLVVMQKRIEEALIAMGPLPANVETAHHNAVAGRDEWRDVAGLVLVGRTLPPPGSVGAMAEALSGSHVPLLAPWYQRTDAMRETLTGAELTEADRHPDPLAEAIRWQICEGELVQIIGRGRGVNRTAANPLDVLVLCDVLLPLPVAETVTSASLDPTLPERMLAEGGAVFEASAHAAQAYPGMWPSTNAAKMAFQRARLDTFPYERILIGECIQPLARADYQVAGAGQRPAVAWFDPLVVSDPEEWMADRLGPLAWCRVVDPLQRTQLVLLPAPGQWPQANAPAAEMVPVVPDCVPGLVPEAVYPGRVLEPPPADMLVIGPCNRPLAMIEAPAMGPFMGARAVTSRGLGPWLLLARRPDDPLALVRHLAFLPPSTPQRMLM